MENKLFKMAASRQNEENSESEESEPEDERDVKKKFLTEQLLTPLERWERSLVASTSLSQLFLHLATLDNSITWSRSALNARCRICRRKSDPDNMLLCDGCDKGHHIYCLKPKLKVTCFLLYFLATFGKDQVDNYQICNYSNFFSIFNMYLFTYDL